MKYILLVKYIYFIIDQLKNNNLHIKLKKKINNCTNKTDITIKEKQVKFASQSIRIILLTNLKKIFKINCFFTFKY